MKLFVWTDVEEGLTDRYHSGGAAAAWADDVDQARELIRTMQGYELNPLENCEVFSRDPDVVIDQASAAQAFIFQNAGCC